MDGRQNERRRSLWLAVILAPCAVLLVAFSSMVLAEKATRDLAVEFSLQNIRRSLPELTEALEGWRPRMSVPVELTQDLALFVHSLVMKEAHHLPVIGVVVVYPDGSAVLPDTVPVLPDLSSDPLWLSSALRGYDSVRFLGDNHTMEAVVALPLLRRDNSLVGGVLLRLDASESLFETQAAVWKYRWFVGAGFGGAVLVVLAVLTFFWRLQASDSLALVREIALRRHMEENARSITRALQDIAGPLPTMVARVDHRQHYVFATTEYCRWFGTFGSSNPVGTNLLAGENFEFHLGENYIQVSDLVTAALDGLSAVSEGVWSFPDGVRHARVELQPVFERAAVRGFFVAITDITAMKHLERDLRKARDRMEEEFAIRALEHRQTVESRLVEALDKVSEGFLLWDSHDCLLLCNQAFRSLFPSLAGRVVAGIRYADVAALLDALEQAGRSLSEGLLRPHERCFGGKLWVLMAETRTPEGLTVLTFTDISERKAAELALLSSEADLRELHRITSHAECGMAEKVSALLNLGGRRLGMPVAFLARCEGDVLVPEYAVGDDSMTESGHVMSFLGTSLADLLKGQDVIASGSDGVASENPVLAVRVMVCGRVWGVLVFRETHPSGRMPQSGDLEFVRLMALWIGAQLTYAETETYLRAALEQADAASRSKSQFLANMSHELRTPLNAIIGFSDVMVNELFGPPGAPQYKDYASSIKESGLHLLSIINDILDTARVEAGHLNLDEEVVTIACLVDGTIRLLRERADSAGLSVFADIPADIPSIRGDVRRLRQVLLNLLSNAIKFTPSGGKITVGAECTTSRGMTIRVVDTGIGMRPEDIVIAVAPFGQIDSGLARQHEGTGLGLPLSRSLVEAHGGQLSLFSKPGEGTEVRVWLPPERLVPKV